jgi:glycosyltransferase involved in cell wall biosynthesis
MHVVLVTTSYPESSSGSEAAGGFVAEFANQLARHAQVTVVAAASGPASVRTEGPVRVHRFSVKRWPLSLLRPYHPADWWPIYAVLRDGMRSLDNAVAENRPDCILALWALPSGYWANTMLRKFGIPYAVWALGSDIWSLGRILFLRSYLRRVLGAADRCYADGLQLAQDVTKLCGAPCDFMPSARQLPLDDRTDLADTPPYRLAFLGRWHRNKGIDILLEALRQLSDDDWTRISEVRIHGGGPLEADVRNTVQQLQAVERPISVGGYLDTVGAAKLIGWADYLALPSRVESIPVIFSDAAQMGRPLIATPVGDLPGLFDRRAFGVLASDTTVTAYAAALRTALRTPASQFQTQLVAFAKEFDIADVAQKFAAYVEEISR